MTPNDIALLKSKIDKEPITLAFTDGEITSAKILSVSESEKDVIFDVISTNRPKKYLNKNGVHLVAFDRLASIS